MNEIATSVNDEGLDRQGDGALELRIFRVMIASVVLAVLGSTVLAPWRVTTGLLLGGLLSLLNHHWLRGSIAVLLDPAIAVTRRPRFRILRFVFRYSVIAAAVLIGYELDWISVPATLLGLCSFAVAFLVEAFRQFYFAIIHREESY